MAIWEHSDVTHETAASARGECPKFSTPGHYQSGRRNFPHHVKELHSFMSPVLKGRLISRRDGAEVLTGSRAFRNFLDPPAPDW